MTLPHVQEGTVNDEQQDKGDDAAANETAVTLGDCRISLGVDGTDKNGGHDETDQHIACIVSAQEGIDERIGDGRTDRRPYRAGDAHDGDDDQNEGQKRRQIFAHPVHDVILISSKEKGNDEIYDDERNERC